MEKSENTNIQSHIPDDIKEDSSNKRYLALSRRFRFAAFLSLFLLILVVLGMMIVFREDITYENFNYMFRDLDTVLPEFTGQRGTVYFDAAGDKLLVPFRGSLGIVSSKSVAFYNNKGSNTFSDDVSLISPMVSTSVRYLLVYDLGGTKYRLYNGYTFHEGEETEYPILDGAVSDSGVYAIVTKNLKYRTVVDIFNENFNKSASVFKDRYVTDIKIDKSGSRILILSISAESGMFNSEIYIVSPTGDKPIYEERIDGAYAVECNFLDNGGFSVLTDSGILFYSNNNERVSTFNENSSHIEHFYSYGSYTVAVFSKNVVGYESDVYILDNSGKTVGNAVVSGEILSLAASDYGVYFLHNGSVDRVTFNGKDLKTASLDTSPNSLVADGGNLIIGYSGSAVIYPENTLFTSDNEQGTGNE